VKFKTEYKANIMKLKVQNSLDFQEKLRRVKIHYLNSVFRQERSNSFWYSELVPLVGLNRFCDLGRFFNIQTNFGLQPEVTT